MRVPLSARRQPTSSQASCRKWTLASRCFSTNKGRPTSMFVGQIAASKTKKSRFSEVPHETCPEWKVSLLNEYGWPGPCSFSGPWLLTLAPHRLFVMFSYPVSPAVKPERNTSGSLVCGASELARCMRWLPCFPPSSLLARQLEASQIRATDHTSFCIPGCLVLHKSAFLILLLLMVENKNPCRQSSMPHLRPVTSFVRSGGAIRTRWARSLFFLSTFHLSRTTDTMRETRSKIWNITYGISDDV